MALTASRTVFLVLCLTVMASSVTCATTSCPEGYELSAGACKRLFTHCNLQNTKTEFASSWVTLETETCATKFGTRQGCIKGELSITDAAAACTSRGLAPLDFVLYVSDTFKVRPCVDRLFARMTNSGNYGNTGSVSVWTGYRFSKGMVSYNHGPRPSVSFGSDGKRFALCSAIWKFHHSDSWSAAKINRHSPYLYTQFANDTCESIGYRLVSELSFNAWKNDHLRGLFSFMGPGIYMVSQNSLAQFHRDGSHQISSVSQQGPYRVLCLKICVGGRLTSNRECACNQGWSGEFCDQPICTHACANGGTCVAPDQCLCPSGYGGALCNIVPCDCNGGQSGGCKKPFSATPSTPFKCHCRGSDGKQYGQLCNPNSCNLRCSGLSPRCVLNTRKYKARTTVYLTGYQQCTYNI